MTGNPGVEPSAVKPEVVVSVWGRFHAFDLARELQMHGALSRLITSYPKFGVRRFDINPALASCLPLTEAIARGGRKLPTIGDRLGIDYKARDLFQKLAAKAFEMTSGNVFVGWSGSSLTLLERAKRRGFVTVLESGSVHILEQTEVLRREYAAFGLDFNGTPKFVEEQVVAECDVADYIAVPSQFALRSFVERGVQPDRLFLNPYGVDLSAFCPNPKAHESFRIMQVGQVSILKGSWHVIDAFREAAIPNSELWFVGGLSREAKTFFAKNEIPGVKLHGAVPQSCLPDLYGSCDVACLGSVQEGFGMVLLQAAACGLPIVCTTATGGLDLFGNGQGGIVVQPGDVSAMAAAFVRLHQDQDLRRRLGAQARLRVEEDFSWRAYGERAFTHYRTALLSRT